MKERPILFSAPMVRAILEDRKTQTRRIVKGAAWKMIFFDDECDSWCGSNEEDFMNDPHAKVIPPQYGVPGDRLWVKETFQMHTTLAGIRVTYREDNSDAWIEPPETWEGIPDDNHWRPSLFMPRWASRITLEIEAVRVERLHEISEEDSVAEGIIAPRMDHSLCEATDHPIATLVFSELWESINGPGSWDANPWVEVIQFRRIKP